MRGTLEPMAWLGLWVGGADAAVLQNELGRVANLPYKTNVRQRKTKPRRLRLQNELEWGRRERLPHYYKTNQAAADAVMVFSFASTG